MKVMLAKKYTDQRVTGWLMSEKLDGVRAIWKDGKLISRNNKPFYAPKWFTDKLPNETLDGELFIGRRQFQKTVSVVRKKVPIDSEWNQVCYKLFDLPDVESSFAARAMSYVGLANNIIFPVEQVICSNVLHLREFYRRLLEKGAEGIIVKNDQCMYENKRSGNMLKIKPVKADEALVIGYQPGNGKYNDMVGALLCDWNGKQIELGTGLSDLDRANPPQVGSIVTFKYQELTDGGMPRFPVFIAERIGLVVSYNVTRNERRQTVKLKDLKVKPPNILLGGPAGGGKTCLASQAAGGYLMDWDGHMKSALTVKDKFSDLRQQIEFDEFVDEIDLSGGTPRLVSAKYLEGKNKLLEISAACVKGNWPFDALIVDTLTGLVRSIQLHVMACAGTPFKKPQIQNFGDFINELESMLTIMRSIPVLKIVTAHEMILFGSQDEHKGTRLMSATKPHGANKLAWLFDYVFMTKKRLRGQGRVDYIVTDRHEIAKGPPIGDLVHNEIGLKGFLEKLEYSYGK